MRPNDPHCRDHRHPKLRRPVPRKQVRRELADLYHEAGFEGRLDLDWPRPLGRVHDGNWRRYAQVAPLETPPHFELAPQTVYLPAENRRALLAHEVGHALDPRGSEDEADAAAFDALGVDVGYDRRWPGKGLQVAMNPDVDMRELERRAATGDVEAQSRLLLARMRAGEVPREEVMRRSRSGDMIATKALGLEPGDLQVLDAIGRTKRGKLRKVTGRNGRDAVGAWLEARGYAEDRYGALVKGGVRIKFKPRVYEVYKGSPGSWYKSSSHSYVAKAEGLGARAQERLEGGGAVEKLQKKRVKQVKRRTKQRKTKALRELALRAAAVQASLELTPADRRAIVHDEGAYKEFWRRVNSTALAAERTLPSDATRESVDGLLSVDHPPIPAFQSSFYDRPTVPLPEEFTWNDPQLGLPITVKRAGGSRAIEVQIGNLWVDPLAKQLTIARASRGFGQEKTGISGLVRVMQTKTSSFVAGTLFMIMSASPRKGTGTNLVRAWCRLMRAYGVSIWVAEAVGDEGAPFFEELQRRGEIEVVEKIGRNWLIRCLAALDDPLQQLLFHERRNPEPEKFLPAPVRAMLPRRMDFVALRTGAAPLIYLPERVQEDPAITQALTRLVLSHPLEGGLATPDAWEDLLAAAGRRARVFAVDPQGGRWEVLRVSFDPGGYTGEIEVRHQGRLGRAGRTRWLDLREFYGRMIPIVAYKGYR